MPPFSGRLPSSAGLNPKRPEPSIVTLNVGGQLFQTTPQTLSLAGPKSLLSSLPCSSSSPSEIPFIDRDPQLFSLLLSLLRTGRLPSSSAAFDLDDLLAEARFYGLDADLLLSPLSDPSLFDPFALRRSLALPLPGRDPPSALSAAPSGSLLVAHGSKITAFDPALRRRATVLTRFPAVDSLLALSPSLAAAGATDFPGLHLLDLARAGSVAHALHWSPLPATATTSSSSSAAGATVQAIGASPDLLFGSFESCRRNASAILAFDRNTFEPVAEIGRREIYGAELDSAIPATKLSWIHGFNLLMAAGSHGGPSGLLGNIRLWDVRSGEAVWDLKESADCFADITVSDSLSSLFKVGVNSGEVFMADMRKLSAEEPWVCLGDARKAATGRKEGSGCRIESHGRQVFCSRGGEVEMWTEVLMGPSTRSREDGLNGERIMRRNMMGRAKDGGAKKITLLGFGGSRMVVARKDEQCVEVWESSAWS
ncbi:BTB/POZ domain-containing protein At5g41330-like [Phoenix dactylifera]|uniref:BTB/POZ domain-containing protein At5g41330-like n=1 Tax=Phoenix dactylifera TaxID=42345 RepID=A0A8B7MUG1_PHODC|nr:BTB/POZ domain-containing protein At5g41330-like [Phoenix dactylifera]XP_017699085.1 BTB/POZ domain-containing protein At5g41330-like [Phoenix dactylifera]XP_026661709.1 BTB/POZ domain-containing protein At5g41330-like [Phoenix dactylifera]